MINPLVSFRKVTKSYGSLKAIENFSLDIAAGKFVTLLGPSGCGKSTTLRLLGGFEQPDSGQILLDGHDITHLAPHKRHINTVFQDYALFPHMTVAQNVAFGLEMKGMDKVAIATHVNRLLEMVELQDYCNRLPRELSGGQRQRVALVRALAPDPKILLLDEPLSALDAKLRQQMQIELKSIQKNTGKSFIFVTHDQEEALTMSDEIILINKGIIEQRGTPTEIYHQPRTAFAANFIGEINMIEAKIIGKDAKHFLLDWRALPLKAPIEENFDIDENILLLIRPEILTPLTQQAHIDQSHCNIIDAFVENRIFKGAHESLILRSASGVRLSMLIHSEITVVNLGDKIQLCWPISRSTIIRKSF